MRIAVIPTLVLVSSLTAVAQQPAQLRIPPGAVADYGQFACPLGMDVKQGIGSRMMAVDKSGAKVEMFAARIRLLLRDRESDKPSPNDKPAPSIVKARVTVHGLNSKERILPVDSHSDDSGLLTKTFTVSMASWGEAEVSGDLLLPGFTAARMVDLESVTYADGSTWTVASPAACHAAPDMLMPVHGS